MLEVHPPHEPVHTWKGFLIHIAAITIGLLMALGLEATVEWIHHKHQAQHGLELLNEEVRLNRSLLERNVQMGNLAERNHRAALAVLARLRAGTPKPDDRLVFVRRYDRLRSSAWKVVHDSNAAAYIPYEVMAQYGEIYEMQQELNESAVSAYAALQRATSVLNTENDDETRNEQDRALQDAEAAVVARQFSPAALSDEAENAVNAKLSGNPDLSRLTPEQITRLQQGFQQAITDDRFLHRNYIYLKALYGGIRK